MKKGFDMEHLAVYLLTISIACTSCSEKDIDSKNTPVPKQISSIMVDENYVEETYENDIVQWDYLLDNPYEINVMQTAYNILIEQLHVNQWGYDICAPYKNAVYFRVKPTDEIEQQIVFSDTTIDYTDVPYDAHIIYEGTNATSPDWNQSDEFVWMYAVVPYGHPLPNINNVEILAECYIPEDSCTSDSVHNGNGLLEYMAYEITHNLDQWNSEDILFMQNILHDGIFVPLDNMFLMNNLPNRQQYNVNSPQNTASTNGYPQGIFSVYDTENDMCVGIAHTKVVIHNFVKIYKGISVH